MKPKDLNRIEQLLGNANQALAMAMEELRRIKAGEK